MKEFFIVGIGSFFGGGLRYLVSRYMPAMTTTGFPWATFIVNILGCLVIGFVSGLFAQHTNFDTNIKLLLTTGFCGGFTTFSTFMNENFQLIRVENISMTILYILSSLIIGLLFVISGYYLSKVF